MRKLSKMNWKRKMTTVDGENVAKEYRRKFNRCSTCSKKQEQIKGSTKIFQYVSERKKKNSRNKRRPESIELKDTVSQQRT